MAASVGALKPQECRGRPTDRSPPVDVEEVDAPDEVVVPVIQSGVEQRDCTVGQRVDGVSTGPLETVAGKARGCKIARLVSTAAEARNDVVDRERPAIDLAVLAPVPGSLDDLLGHRG